MMAMQSGGFQKVSVRRPVNVPGTKFSYRLRSLARFDPELSCRNVVELRKNLRAQCSDSLLEDPFQESYGCAVLRASASVMCIYENICVDELSAHEFRRGSR